MNILIKGGTIVNEGMQQRADIIIEQGRIKEIIQGGINESCVDSFNAIKENSTEWQTIDAAGAYILPGVIDSHVHFREPGLTHKADMLTESRAAAYGGVTSVFDMPNTKPQTTTIEALHDKQRMAEGRMHVNYAFFPGATNDNIDELRQLDRHEVPGIKLFMGSSTGNMLVDKEEALDSLFALATEMGLPLMAHCEDTETINHNMERCKEEMGVDDPPVQYHPYIRSEEACYASSSLGARLARKHNTPFHIAHITTARELPLLGDNITGEATVAHLLFSQEDYDDKGALIKCNPAIKSLNDRDALRLALSAKGNEHIHTIGTDHAPHDISEKQGGAAKAMSGMPMIQFSLIAMLSLVDKGIITMERLVELMAHNPATLFGVSKRGFLRNGYHADIAIVRRMDEPRVITRDMIQSKCRWSPVEGKTFHWQVEHTIVNGWHVYDNGKLMPEAKGEQIVFRQ